MPRNQVFRIAHHAFSKMVAFEQAFHARVACGVSHGYEWDLEVDGEGGGVEGIGNNKLGVADPAEEFLRAGIDGEYGAVAQDEYSGFGKDDYGQFVTRGEVADAGGKIRSALQRVEDHVGALDFRAGRKVFPKGGVEEENGIAHLQCLEPGYVAYQIDGLKLTNREVVDTADQLRDLRFEFVGYVRSAKAGGIGDSAFAHRHGAEEKIRVQTFFQIPDLVASTDVGIYVGWVGDHLVERCVSACGDQVLFQKLVEFPDAGVQFALDRHKSDLTQQSLECGLLLAPVRGNKLMISSDVDEARFVPHALQC